MTPIRAAAAATALAVSVAAGCGSEGTDGDSSGGPTTEATVTGFTVAPSDDTAAASGQPQGFTTMQARITNDDGEVCEVCVWLADVSEERARGLMGVTDLGDAVGMAFRYDEPTGGSFYMFQTPTPLSIAWFAADTTYVGSADMEPCLDRAAGDCERYSPGQLYEVAVEVFDGGLEPLGIGPGSTFELLDGTEAASCSASMAE